MAKKHCECCGAPMVEYKHGLSKGLARCLYRLAIAGGKDVCIKNLDLTNSQYTNFPKIKYWGLATNATDVETGGRGGVWSITEKGWAFVKGEINIPRFAILYRNELLRYEGGDINIKDITDGWKYKPEYVAESQPH